MVNFFYLIRRQTAARAESQRLSKNFAILCVLCVSAFIGLLAGCHKTDPKIAALESRVTSLEADVAALEIRTDAETNTDALALADHNFLDGVYDAQTNLSDDVSWLLTRVGKLEDKATAAPPIYHSTTGSVMPAEVAAQIRSRAAESFPNNYDMQLFQIKQEADAWHKLNP